MKRMIDPSLNLPKPADNYWRSLEHLADDPEFQRYLKAEFPSLAPSMDQGIDRRQLLGLMGASLALAGLASCRRPIEHIVPYVDAPENIVPGVPKHYATTMPLGMDNIGVLVESHEGRPTKIEGNPDHPASNGASSSILQAAVLGLYDPDRSQAPTEAGLEKTWAEFSAAWKAIEQAHLADQGQGLAVLAESFSSPTLARLAAAFQARFPQSRWITYEAISDEQVFEGLEMATGTPFRPTLHFDQASTILSLDSDFLLTESNALIAASRFSQSRRVDSPSSTMSRLYVVENGFSLTGAAADHRLRLQTSRVGAFCAGLAAELNSLGVGVQAPSVESADLAGVSESWLRALAQDLRDAGPKALVVAGWRQPPEVHALVFAINAALGSVGQTVRYFHLQDASRPRRGDLAALASEIESGALRTLLILGGNPAYTAPGHLKFDRLLGSLENSIHLGPYRDETSQAVQWHLPQTHFLEQWGDARTAEGILSVIQPLIEPLYGARSTIEILGLMATGNEIPGYELVRQTWAARLRATDFEAAWRRILHDGLLKGSGASPAAPTLTADSSTFLPPRQRRIREDDLEIAFQASSTLFDGRFANNSWLQETPDPITKLTWDNVAQVSPATAEQLGVASGDRVLLTFAGSKVEFPIWIQPGHADGTVSLTHGYGRTRSGRVGNGVGSNAFRLTSAQGVGFGLGLRLERTRRRQDLSSTQDHGSMEGRHIVQEASLQEYIANPTLAKLPEPREQLFDSHSYEEGHQWGMAIDLNACIGCNACVTACQSENNVPVVGKTQVGHGREMHWIRVDRYFSGPSEDPRAVFQPMPCQHCENAPCEQVCPVAATVHDSEGVNVMVYNRCIGTRYCSNNCPYKVRRFNFFNYTKDTPEVSKMAYNPDVTVRSRGVMEKCSFCIQRINAAKYEAKRRGTPLVDGDIRTACQQACPTQAIVFGDLRDPRSQVARAKALDRDYVVLGELNNRPRVSYQAKLRNPNPALVDG